MDNQITRKFSVSSGLFYLTFNKVDVALVCQTRNFQTQLVVCMLCFPNIVHVIFIRTVSFNFHLNHGHLRVWLLKEQEAHFIENIRHYLWLKSWFLCQVDKLRDFVQIFFYKLWKVTIDPGNAIFCANFLLGNTLCPAASFVKRVLSALVTGGGGGGAEVTALTHHQNGRYSGYFFLINFRQRITDSSKNPGKHKLQTFDWNQWNWLTRSKIRTITNEDTNCLNLSSL